MYKSIISPILFNCGYSKNIKLFHMVFTSQLSSYPVIYNRASKNIQKVIEANCISSFSKNCKRFFCDQKPIIKNNPSSTKTEDVKPSALQRFKETYAVYGKLCVVVHIVTYFGWFGLFFFLVHSGVDVKAVLTALHLPDWITSLIGKPGYGEVATAYVLCKIFMFFRYGLTIYLTRYIGAHLRRLGYMAPIKEENRIRNLANEGKEQTKQKIKSQFQRKK